MREEQQRRKQPTGYDRLCLGKTQGERRELPGFSETPVVRMRIPDDVELLCRSHPRPGRRPAA
jgi:glutamyl-tRNA synthetase